LIRAPLTTSAGFLLALLLAPELRADDEADLFASVAGILQSSCARAACHAGPEAAQRMRLETGRIYRSTVNVRSRTNPPLLLVSPGAPDRSLLYLKLLSPEQGHYRGPRMPQGMDPLSEETIELVRKWIESFPGDRWGEPPEEGAPAATPRTFHDSHLANLPTPDPLGDGALEFRILHRFKPSAPDADGQNLYGLDAGAWISIGLAYGFTGTLEAGVRRTNFQPVGRDYEGFVKWAPLRQGIDRTPLSLSLRASASSIRDPATANRNRWGAQAILGRRLGKRVSLMLVPTYVTRTNPLDSTDRSGTAAVGVGGELRLNSKMALTLEWVGQAGGFKNPFQSASLGFSIATARHAFLLIATNTGATHTDLYAPGGDLEWGHGNFRLGFNISRTYTPH
jgi:hypothetical protein